MLLLTEKEVHLIVINQQIKNSIMILHQMKFQVQIILKVISPFLPSIILLDKTQNKRTLILMFVIPIEILKSKLKKLNKKSTQLSKDKITSMKLIEIYKIN